MAFDKHSANLLQTALDQLEVGFSDLPPYQTETNFDELAPILQEVAQRMQDNYPYHHPLYAGQMLKPPHPIARLAYSLSIWINPNNHALDGGRASSAMEKEAVAEIAAMFGWGDHLGHLTSGGTMANLEALWIAGLINPGKKIVASSQAHYTHNRICGVLGLEFEAIACDQAGRMDVDALEIELKKGGVGTVVVTLGTTATGSVDPLHKVLALQAKYGFRIHADTAYGGYFTLVDNLDAETQQAFSSLSQVDSIVVDPHKHGLQPYGCGCILFKDPAVGSYYKHDSPYTYFSSSELHLGEISLECSRPGSSAVAVWATQKLLPLSPGGKFSKDLAQSRQAALTLLDKIEADQRFFVPFKPELDIIIWAPRADTVSEASNLSRLLFEEAASRDLHLALAELPVSFFPHQWAGEQIDQETITCLRSCLMKPEHLEWVEDIWKIIDAAAHKVLE